MSSSFRFRAFGVLVVVVVLDGMVVVVVGATVVVGAAGGGGGAGCGSQAAAVAAIAAAPTPTSKLRRFMDSVERSPGVVGGSFCCAGVIAAVVESPFDVSTSVMARPCPINPLVEVKRTLRNASDS